MNRMGVWGISILCTASYTMEPYEDVLKEAFFFRPLYHAFRRVRSLSTTPCTHASASAKRMLKRRPCCRLPISRRVQQSLAGDAFSLGLNVRAMQAGRRRICSN